MNRKTQNQRILTLLETYNGEWVSLVRILDLRIANYRARISELRKQGYNILCEKQRTETGELHTKYRLIR